MSTTESLAALIVETKYESMPPQVIEAAKVVIMDGMGVMLAGSQEEPARIVADHVNEMGCAPRCTVFGQGFSTAPTMAAFANGVAGHVLDYEPMWHPATHPTSPTLPGVLALAELHSLPGSDVLGALIIGFEVQGRIRVASAGMDLSGFHPPGLVGTMGSAAACSRLLGLDIHQTRMALAIAGSRPGALSANIGTMTKSTHCGNAGRMGLESALLAAKGFTGNDSIFEHPVGYANVLFGPEFDLDAVTRNFGDSYRLVDPGVGIKKHPSQFGTQRGIDAALELHHLHDVNPANINRVRIRNPMMPYVDRPYPSTGLEGKFSFQYTVASALLDGQVTIQTFTDERRHRPDMEEMLTKIDLHMDPEIPSDFEGMWTSVEIDTVNGNTYSARCDLPRGIWGTPLRREERLTKFRNCASTLLSEESVDQCASIIENLDEAQNIRELIRITQSAPRTGRYLMIWCDSPSRRSQRPEAVVVQT